MCVLYIYTNSSEVVWLFCRGAGEVEDAPVSVAMQSFGGNMVVLALCRDIHLRLWATEVSTHIKKLF